MDLTSHNNASDNTEASTNKDYNQSECILNQPKANGTLPHHSTGEAPPPLSDRLQDTDNSDESLTDSSSTNDVSRLLPAHWKQKDETSSSEAPVCTPPQSTCPSLPPSRSSTSNRHHHQSTNHKRLSSTKSHASFKTDAAQIKEVAGDDCCVHCLLACLFCEMLSMCSALGECMACGVGVTGCCEASDGCCCCVEAAGEAACTEEACQAALDCGLLEDCCCSSDCMEICLECCSICFPS
ncbi:myoD family inhibitor [Cololabis saira]|uniref:myoD family inhibitor n=1 Tax=Cololabis saira TaxID=129043 RepID=UPI002AD35C03|nr:myoD family inhibitor [Cololabis saira]